MASSPVVLALASLLVAGAAQAATPGTVRLPFNLHGLQTGSEVVYHPTRWLTLRRSISYVRAAPRDDIVRSTPRFSPRPRAYALTGDVHPFGDALRVSLGLREDDNRRLLRGTGDSVEIATGRYAPLATVGVAGEVAEGLFLAGDMGFVGRTMTRPSDSLFLTPADMLPGARDGGQAYRPVVQLSAGYRF